jgi:hypothetical protein
MYRLYFFSLVTRKMVNFAFLHRRLQVACNDVSIATPHVVHTLELQRPLILYTWLKFFSVITRKMVNFAFLQRRLQVARNYVLFATPQRPVGAVVLGAARALEFQRVDNFGNALP